ncbi:MAG: ethanolamine ammonia-lyase subunit EutC [Firmicutes bacterium]|jgi:ethanolamine ammonia-lyase small subunit|nr:ethanolamine ammonia-lyase subunit EutC [Bacillota bacterium]
MKERELIDIIAREVMAALYGEQEPRQDVPLTDISSAAYKADIKLDQVENPLALDAMRTKTPARIGIGKAGPRLGTKTLLALRADHASAKDAVLKSVDENILKELGLFSVQSLCGDIDEHLTRPDLGRRLSEETKLRLQEHCVHGPRVQIYVSDGLSSLAVDENISDLLPVMIDGLEAKGIKTGTPFFVKYGRVPTMDVISEILNAEVTCVLLGERPGLAAAGSMSAYIAYRAAVGMPESRRTVISNIHTKGIQPVEAGAYAVDVITKILEAKASGVDFKL